MVLLLSSFNYRPDSAHRWWLSFVIVYVPIVTEDEARAVNNNGQKGFRSQVRPSALLVRRSISTATYIALLQPGRTTPTTNEYVQRYF